MMTSLLLSSPPRFFSTGGISLAAPVVLPLLEQDCHHRHCKHDDIYNAAAEQEVDITIIVLNSAPSLSSASQCVFLASGYSWVTVMHEIPISSAQTMTSFHTLELSSTIPLVPLERGLFHMRRLQRVCSI
jgi:hypothetical protein